MNLPEKSLDALLVILEEFVPEFFEAVLEVGSSILLDTEFSEEHGIKHRAEIMGEKMAQVDRPAHDYLHAVHGDCDLATGDPLAHARMVLRLAASAYVFNDAQLAEIAHGTEVVLFDIVMSSSVALEAAPPTTLMHLSEVGAAVRWFLEQMDAPVDMLNLWAERLDSR